MTQPDVLEFIRTWLGTQVSGTPLQNVSIVSDDDPGNREPPWVFLEDAGSIHLPGVPFYQPYRMAVTTYGRTNREAGRMYRALTDILHDAAHVHGNDGLMFAGAEDETGANPGPEGRWPARLGIVAIYLPDRPLS